MIGKHTDHPTFERLPSPMFSSKWDEENLR